MKLVLTCADKNQAIADTVALPLDVAFGQGHLEVVCMLLEAGSDKNWAITNHGLWLMHIESEEGHAEVTNGSEEGTGWHW